MGRTALLVFAGTLAVLLAAGVAAGQSEDPNDQADQWLTSEQNVTFDRVPGGTPNEDGGPPTVAVDGTIRLHQFQFRGSTYSADEFRSAYDRNVIGDDAVDRMESEVQSRFESNLAETLPLAGSPNTTPAEMTNESLEAGYDDDRPYHPPLVFHVSGGGDLDLAGATEGDADPEEMGVALELGASLGIPMSVGADAGENRTIHLQAPAGLAWNVEGTPAGVEAREEAAVVDHTVTNWLGAQAETRSLPLELTDPGEAAYEEEQVDLEVVVDIEGVDLQPTRFPGGSLGQGTGTVTLEGELAVVELPDGAPDALREAGVTHIAADDIRLLVEEGLVERSTIEDRVSNLTGGFTEETPEQVDVVVSGGLVPESLSGVDRSADDTARPVRIEFNADVFVDLSAGSNGGGAQALSLYSVDRAFTFPSLEGYATTYEVILPKGMAVESVDVQEGEPATVGTNEDGRDYFRLDVDEGDEREATVHASFTESFPAHQAPELFFPLLLLLLIPILLVARLVTRGGGDEEPTRVEEPDLEE